MALQLANVALSDTFNTWRVRTNQIIAEAGSSTSTSPQTFAANTTFSANVSVTGTLSGASAAFTGPVTAPIITSNTVNGTTANFTTLQADSIDFDGDLTVDKITANTAVFAGLVTAPKFNANNLGGTLTTAAQGNITSVGTLTSLTVSGTAGFNGPVTAPAITANSFSGDGSGLTGLSAGLDWSTTTSTNPHYLIVASNTSGSGIDQFNVATGITIHPGSARITANTFIGDGSGLTGISAGATVTDKSDNVDYNIIFTSETSGNQSLAGIDNGALIYNPSTGQLSATDFNSTSDVAYKYDINPIQNASDIVLKLAGKAFKWKHTDRQSYGVVAQELEQVLPDVVNENTNGKTVNYNTLIAFLIESNKELINRLNVLESKLEK